MLKCVCPHDTPNVNRFTSQRTKGLRQYPQDVFNGSYEHKFFFVLEADDYQSIHNFFQPVFTLGDIEVVPAISAL